MSYLAEMARSVFGGALKGIAKTDAFLRQPDYSSRALEHAYLILAPAEFSTYLAGARYLQAEFPEVGCNYLTTSELARFPAHGIWQFQLADWLEGGTLAREIVSGVRSNRPEALRQALFSVAHLARLYYFRTPTPKIHLWGVRQFGWALRYVEYGLLPLWSDAVPEALAADLAWVHDCNSNWPAAERLMLSSQSAFEAAALRLSRIAERFCRALAPFSDDQGWGSAALADASITDVSALDCLVASLRNTLGDNLVAVYLHGSMARREHHHRSDIDLIVVVSEADDSTLQRTRQCAAGHPGVSFGLISCAGLRQYPHFRRYTLAAEITRCLYGRAVLPGSTLRTDDLAALDHNVCTIRQVSRSYLASGTYGPRAHAVALLMVKLADHGCLRLLQKLETGIYPESRDASRDFYANNPRFTGLLADVAGAADLDERLREALLAGQHTPLEDLFNRLLDFAAACAETAAVASMPAS